MNERIKTLAKVAGYDEINKAAMKLTGFDPEKFAELIIRECSNIAYEYDGAKLSGPGLIIASRIKQHFGVES